MDSNVLSPSPDNTEMKAAFRKPSSEAANRKYRRHSPANLSSSSGSPKRERSSSPVISRGDPSKLPEYKEKRKEDERELDKDSDQHSTRNPRSYSRHIDSSRHEKHAENEERRYHASFHSGRESRGATHSDYTREESERGRSRDYLRNSDKYSREKYDSAGNRSKDREKESISLGRQKFKDKDSSPDRGESDRRYANSTFEERNRDRDRHKWDRDGRDKRRDYHRSLGDHKSDRSAYCEESRAYRNDSSGRNNDGHRSREPYKNHPKEANQREKKKYGDEETNEDKDRYNRPSGEQSDNKSLVRSENKESVVKKPKLFSSSSNTDLFVKDEKQSSSLKQGQEIDGNDTVGQVSTGNIDAANDLNAAKVAAMKAAELVNKNLVGVGVMSTEQKKKLLWGNKKSTTSEESGHRWNNALIGDRERQEKFNKLMGVKGDVKVEHKPDNQDGSSNSQAEKQKELQMDLEKQYTAGLRRRDGRTVGLGL